MSFKKNILIIIFLIFLIKNINSQSFKGNQKQQVNALLSQIYQGNVYEGFQCMLNMVMCSGDTVIGINIFTGVPVTLTVDFSVFEDLTYFISSSAISFSPNIFSRLPNFTSPEVYFNIGKMNDQIPEDIVLPENLYTVEFKSISVPLPNAFFSTGAIGTILINNANPGFALPNQFPQNNFLKQLNLNIIGNGFFPSNAGSALSNLTELTLNINNYNTKNITFPTFEPFNQLTKLAINFHSADPLNQLFEFEPTINNINTLEELHIENLGFNISNDVDLTNLSKNLKLTFSNHILPLNKFKYPLNCSLDLSNYPVSIYDVDFRNLTSLSLSNVNYGENLPPASNFDFEKLTYLLLSSNQFNGSLPEEYCSFVKGSLALGSNDLTGSVPDCFKCLGGEEFPGLFPNNFDDFFDDTPADVCTAFSLDVPVNQLLKTNETTVFEFTGSNLGWDSDIESTQANVELAIIEPNKKIKITIPPGAGIQNATLKFGSNFSIEVILNYEFYGPTIDSYYVQGSGIFFRGSYFSYNQDYENIFTINKDYKFTAHIQTIEDQNLNNGVGFENDDTPISVLKNREAFNVSIDVAGKQSETVTFIYFGNITMLSDLSSIQLNTTGGDFSFDGEFGCNTTDFSNPIFKINDIDVQILEITETRINITYPPIENAGTYSLYIEVGDFSFTNEIKFIETPTFPPTPTPTSTPTPTPTSTSTSTSDDEGLSTSPTLSISFIYLFSIILLINFVF
ncbi:leucine-rich repeat-containing protein [Dictyostelium discoideum AX4]|uniref:Leucine-rich repeat-containing protein n=1 Tax=Dictyostelium discoideum TaxID=44689 RepID=Q55AC2_DICDI|nr:leucine-rich repeat-containing protein [Dictyostelium discoideum AX4]EAL71460.1 leucine-rich repeat-containing protein [Dictyostelium discoideum AX4]|eukprot:XP_645339.1 leucine-rich repeat-containing protein [Dictyostelium discoideum AX4]